MMMKTTKIFIIFLSISVYFAVSAFAQESKGGFFSDDFVRKGMFDEKKEKIPEENTHEEKIETKSNTSKQVSKTSQMGATEGSINRITQIIEKARGGSSSNQNTLNTINSAASQVLDASVDKKVANKNQLETIKNKLSNLSSNTNNINNYGIKFTKERNDYKSSTTKAVLSVYVSQVPHSHATRAVKDLLVLRKSRNVEIGEIVIIGPGDGKDSVVAEKTFLAAYQELTKDGVVPLKYRSKIPKRFQATGSPLWVVNFNGRMHLLEGNFNLMQHFSKEGVFIENPSEGF